MGRNRVDGVRWKKAAGGLLVVAGAAVIGQADAAVVVLVTEDAGRDAALVSHLESMGHTVSTGAYGDIANNAGDRNTLNAADLVVLSRNSNSGNYANDAAEVAAWDSVASPLILGNGYISRTNRWQWVGTEVMQADYGLDISAPTGTAVMHPYYAGVPTNDADIETGGDPAISGLSKYRLSNSTDIPDGGAVLGDGTTIGVRNNASFQNVYIANWDAGSLTGSGNTLADDRVFFAMPEDFSSYTPAGVAVLDNIVGSYIAVPEPSAALLVGAGTLAGLTRRRRRQA